MGNTKHAPASHHPLPESDNAKSTRRLVGERAPAPLNNVDIMRRLVIGPVSERGNGAGKDVRLYHSWRKLCASMLWCITNAKKR
jgi:hypothetical protein